jgi:hypothetical protein
LDAVSAFCKFEKDGVAAKLEYCRAANLDDSTKVAIWELMVTNMKSV